MNIIVTDEMAYDMKPREMREFLKILYDDLLQTRNRSAGGTVNSEWYFWSGGMAAVDQIRRHLDRLEPGKQGGILF